MCLLVCNQTIFLPYRDPEASVGVICTHFHVLSLTCCVRSCCSTKIDRYHSYCCSTKIDRNNCTQSSEGRQRLPWYRRDSASGSPPPQLASALPQHPSFPSPVAASFFSSSFRFFSSDFIAGSAAFKTAFASTSSFLRLSIINFILSSFFPLSLDQLALLNDSLVV